MASEAVLSAAGRLARPAADGAEPSASPDGPVHGLAEAAGALVGTLAPAVIDHVDIDAILRRVDIDRVLDRIDVDRVLARVDVEALLDRVDIDRLVERIDVGPLAREAVAGLDLGEIIRESTVGIGGQAVHDARLQAMRADRAVEGAVDRVLGREPRGAAVPAPGEAPSRAGIVSRLLATLVDVVVVVLAGLGVLLAIASVRLFWTGRFDIGYDQAYGTRLGGLALLLAYLTYGWGLNGRTVGKLVMGLRVLDEGGTDLSFRRALARAVLSLAVPIGLLWSAVGARSGSLQDLVVRTVVVHDWGPRHTPDRPERRRRG
jgi:uncharacterized RDD family membrane protein YckC